MGKKSGWFSAVRKALRSSASKKKKDKKSSKYNSTRSCFGNRKSFDTEFNQPEPAFTNSPQHYPPKKDTKLTEPKNERIEQAFSAAFAATALAAEAAVRPTPTSRFLGKSKKEIAAIKIQTAYRGYLARRSLWDLRRLGRLKSMVQGQQFRRQTKSTLRCLQTLGRVQSQVRKRRIRMSEDNLALQRQLLQRHQKELKNIRASDGSNWDSRTKSKEQVEASLQSKKEAAEGRERALAYAYSHQQAWRNSKSSNPTFMDPSNPHWGWSWLDRWMAVRPWETQSTIDKDSIGDMGRRPSRQLTSTPPSKSSGKLSTDDESNSKSLHSVRSEPCRCTSVRGNESLSPSASARSYSGPTKSTKVGPRMACHGPSPLGYVNKGNPSPSGTGSRVESAKKQLSFSGSPAAKRALGSRTSCKALR